MNSGPPAKWGQCADAPGLKWGSLVVPPPLNLLSVTKPLGYWVTTRKNLALAVPGARLKLKVPAPSVLVCSGVHRFSASVRLVALRSAKGWPAGPVPAMITALL